MPHHRIPIALLSASAVAALALPGGAAARATDRDHDHMPDRWEHTHGLDVKHDDARRDVDHDGLRNLAEFKAGTDPRDADSDGDGINDGAEDAGTVVTFANGVLTLKTFDGDTLKGRVTDATELQCGEGDHAASPRSESDDEPGEDTADSGDAGVQEHGGDQQENEDGADACTTAALVSGAKVDEAKLAVTSHGNVWREVDLAS